LFAVATSMRKRDCEAVKRTTRTETTVEAHEVLIIRRSRRKMPAWCNRCTGLTTMVTAEEAAKLRNVRARTIYQWVEAGRVHFTDLPDGGLMICLASFPTEVA
jgi:hypothetical protein